MDRSMHLGLGSASKPITVACWHNCANDNVIITSSNMKN